MSHHRSDRYAMLDLGVVQLLGFSKQVLSDNLVRCRVAALGHGFDLRFAEECAKSNVDDAPM
eukprot:CAMPEP_0119526124 /NCGR_PEP_ID=MMETSP1344-20130328/40782_1 /TAXON_ID=236787 /ORGANISM="Florenciella parvula, Strain CCMP2471" /LENGTH=61 /DNA_ID=CAMNT_0007565035 /DNA_START=63 /DNA_END=248 /DNA_ORIENTATION=-